MLNLILVVFFLTFPSWMGYSAITFSNDSNMWIELSDVDTPDNVMRIPPFSSVTFDVKDGVREFVSDVPLRAVVCNDIQENELQDTEIENNQFVVIMYPHRDSVDCEITIQTEQSTFFPLIFG